MTIRLTLPKPIGTNAAYGNRRKGQRGRGRYKTTRYKAWIKAADDYYYLVKADIRPIKEGRYTVKIMLPDTMRGDVDGPIKMVLDYLVSREITPDDRHCASVTATKEIMPRNDQCLVVVEAA